MSKALYSTIKQLYSEIVEEESKQKITEEQVFVVKVLFEDGDHLQTRINGNTEDAVFDYYRVGAEMNVGIGPHENKKLITGVKIL